MSVKKTFFGKIRDGKEVYIFMIKNNQGMNIKVMNYGAILLELFVKNKYGVFKDVVLGYDSLEDYFDNYPMFGAIVGRNVNRIENAEFKIDGILYKLVKNRGRHNIHSDKINGFHKVLWDFEIINDNAVKFNYVSPDGDQGFPGKLDISVTYILTNNNELIISYRGISDKKTLINITNHNYFNLSGYKNTNVLDTEVTIYAQNYTPINEEIIPTGEINKVYGTPMDFTKPKKIGEVIDKDFPQLKMAKGFDHNFVIENPNTGIRKIAEAVNESEGIRMKVYSDLPGMQFYTGNTIKETIGKRGAIYSERAGFCMEPQYFPNSINIKSFDSPIFDANQEYKTTTIYQFI